MPNFWLRLEGLVLLVLSVLAFHNLQGNWWYFGLGMLAVDASMAGYMFGKRMGAWGYNLGHSMVLPVMLLGFGYLYTVQWALLVALVWLAHIGGDRLIGYGLKEAKGFSHTHLGYIGK